MAVRILHVIRSMNPALGGPAEVVRQLSRIHKEMGCIVDVASLDTSENAWVQDDSLSIIPLGERVSAGGGGYGFSRKLVPWLKQQQENYTAVISHGLWQYNNVAVRETFAGSPTPYFVFPHGMLDPWFKRTYPLKHSKKLVYWMLKERNVLRDASAVLFTCEEERLLAQKTFWFYQCREQVVPLGIAPPPPEDYERRRRIFFGAFPEFRNQRILLFLGRLHEKKGCDLLIKSFARIVQQGSNDLRLLIAGPSADPEYELGLRRLAETHCPAGSVSFSGMLTGELKWAAFRSADAFILPSHQENFGMAVVEALACGVPVLISNKVNIWREILEDQAGLVGLDDLDGTVSLLERWNNLPEIQRMPMRAAALASFSKRFHIEQTARTVLALIAGARKKATSPDH